MTGDWGGINVTDCTGREKKNSLSEKMSFVVKKKQAVLRSAGTALQAEGTADAKMLWQDE